MLFAVLSVALGGALAAAGAVVCRGRHPQASLAARLPRARLLGEVLGIVCLVWSAYHAGLMLEGGLAVYRKVIWALVPVIALVAYHHLDYLFGRALGGFLVLSASFLVHGAFASAVPWRPLYCVVCYLLGIWAMTLVAMPWRFRDLLAALSRPGRWQRSVGAATLAGGLVLVILPLLPRAS